MLSLAPGWQRAGEVTVRAMEHGEMDHEVFLGFGLFVDREKRRGQGFLKEGAEGLAQRSSGFWEQRSTPTRKGYRIIVWAVLAAVRV